MSTRSRTVEGLPTSVVITGASSGIGAAVAVRLARDGAAVMLGARRTDRLRQLVDGIRAAGGRAGFRSTDVTDRRAVDALAAAAAEVHGGIDVLVANAGIMPLSPLAARRVDEWDRMIDVNLRGLLHALAAVLPRMEDRGGHVVMLGSVGDRKVAPSAAVYCATKFAVRALADALRQEGAGRIRSTLISPGAVATELPDGVRHRGTAAATRAFYAGAIDADAIAAAVAYAVAQPPEVSVNEIVVRPSAQTF